jgi:putative transposase
LFIKVNGRWRQIGPLLGLPLARVYGERKRNFVGQHFWARGFFVSTVGRDEATVRDYIRNQEKEDQRLEQMLPW